VLASLWGPAVPPASATTLTFGPTADAHIRSEQPDANFGSGTCEGPVPIDTTLLSDGWHRLVLHSAKRVGDKENGGVFVFPFRFCNGA
jgi:hypothetical protein